MRKMKCSVKWKGLFSPPKESDAMSVREALTWLMAKGLDNVFVETNALLIIPGLKSMPRVSSFHLILLDIKDLLAQFSNTCITFVKRSANRIAYVLARESFSSFDCWE